MDLFKRHKLAFKLLNSAEFILKEDKRRRKATRQGGGTGKGRKREK